MVKKPKKKVSKKATKRALKAQKPVAPKKQKKNKRPPPPPVRNMQDVEEKQAQRTKKRIEVVEKKEGKMLKRLTAAAKTSKDAEIVKLKARIKKLTKAEDPDAKEDERLQRFLQFETSDKATLQKELECAKQCDPAGIAMLAAKQMEYRIAKNADINLEKVPPPGEEHLIPVVGYTDNSKDKNTDHTTEQGSGSKTREEMMSNFAQRVLKHSQFLTEVEEVKKVMEPVICAYNRFGRRLVKVKAKWEAKLQARAEAEARGEPWPDLKPKVEEPEPEPAPFVRKPRRKWKPMPPGVSKYDKKGNKERKKREAAERRQQEHQQRQAQQQNQAQNKQQTKPVDNKSPGQLHPSWQAKKQQSSTVLDAPKGKKVKFED